MAPIKTLKPNVYPIIIPVIIAIKIAKIKVIPKIVICNFVYSSFFENIFWNWQAITDLISLMKELFWAGELWTLLPGRCSIVFLSESTDVKII